MQTLNKVSDAAESTFALPVKRRVDDRQSIQERFDAYMISHPDVYELLVKLSCDVKRQGFNRYSMKAIYERARWLYSIEKGDQKFKLQNDFTALFARRIMRNNPELHGLFETRERR